MASWGVTPGPLNDELLFLGGEHRAAYYFQDPTTDAGIIRLRRGDANFWKFIKQKPIHRNVMTHLEIAGFAGIIQCGNRKLDRGLITALVERWRPETHTFHLPVGECTVTLQDVEVLWGLKVDGDAVSGTDVVLAKHELIQKFQFLTGCTLPDNSTDRQKINLVAIFNLIKIEFPENPTDDECKKRARLIILHLIGATIFPDSASNWVHANFLSHVDNLVDCGKLSWGSATLAWLYRQLCKATKMTTRDVSGPLFLLQLWAWERLPTIAPINNRTVNFELPYDGKVGNLAMFQRPRIA
ncbi:hypothetical protein QVD17_39737 [Tagetes erecta]|uniref:Aminotransferase-like plant mobile domain-containing protein n=1 Tax=Tagetes erecta TaxID=13708 RepID=A0AAD8JRB9_TARER|nr:hypothetical protein QVD17_39737 [Tagetes erecta]